MASLSEVAPVLAAVARSLHARGWAFATSGNFSAVLRRKPLVIAISRSGVDKGRISASDFLEVGDNGIAVGGEGEPSAEAVVHLAVVGERGAGAVLHTHSIWNTLVSAAAGAEGGLALEGYEMLKGLAGVATHEHREWLPIIENTQDYDEMIRDVKAVLGLNPQAHALLLRGHGLYTWGRDLEEAQRHVEVLEFLLEIEGRRYASAGKLTASPAGVAEGGRDGDR